MCNPKMCNMKTTVISFFTLMFMISLSAYADGDGSKGTHPKGKTETMPTELTIPSTSNLIVINLNESQDAAGLPQDILQQFGDVMAYPEDVENAAEEECVLVGFSYDDDGFIHVESTRSSNESFDDHVVSSIEKIRLRDGSVTIGKQYFAKFSFKKL
jgi:hypothetical protein